MKNLFRFTIYFFLFLLLVVIIGFLIIQNKGLLNLGELSTIGGIFEGSIGIAVSFAGAYVAIKIAHLGHKIVDKEKKRDDYVQINEILLDSLQPLKDITRALNKILDTQQSFETLIIKFAKNINNLRNESKTKEEITLLKNEFNELYTKELIANFDLLTKSITRLLDNPYSYFIWVESTKDISDNQLRGFAAHKILRYYNQSSLHPSKNLIEISTAIEKRVRNTGYYGIEGHVVFSSYIMTGKAFSSHLDEKYSKPVNLKLNEKILCANGFYEMGSNFWSELRYDENVYVNVGGALLHDLIISIPDSDNLLIAINKLFSNFFDTDISATPLMKLVREMGDSFWMSNSLVNAKSIFLEEPIRTVITLENKTDSNNG